MSDWRSDLAGARQSAVNEEKKRAKEQRAKERAERMRADNRMALARRLMNESPSAQSKAREPVNLQAKRLTDKASEWAKPPPPTQSEIKRDALIAKKREHENALIRINKILRNTLPFAKYREIKASRDNHVRAISKIEIELQQAENKTTKQEGKQTMAAGSEIRQGGIRDKDCFQDTMSGGKKAGGNSGIPIGENPQEFFNIHEVAVRVIAEINKEPHQLTALARAAFDARSVLDENMKQIVPLMQDFNAQVKVALEDMRQSRFAVVGEIAHLLQPLKDVRAFLLGRDYEVEIARLKEFCGLCERLKALKEDGTLDALADTIIKLAL